MDKEKRRLWEREYRARNKQKVAATQARYNERHRKRRRKQWRDFTARKKAALSSEALAAAIERKRLYDLEYRRKHWNERAAYKADPERRQRWAKLWKQRQPPPLVFLGPPVPESVKQELRRERRLVSVAKMKAKWPDRQKTYYRLNREKLLNQKREEYKNNKDVILARHRKYVGYKRKNDPEFRMRMSIYNRVSRLLKGRKSKRTEELLGCTREQFVEHLKSKFKPGMSMDNYGRKGWVLDHVVPTAAFCLSRPDHQAVCFHFSNLAPLWFVENIKKGSLHNGKRHFRSEPKDDVDLNSLIATAIPSPTLPV